MSRLTDRFVVLAGFISGLLALLLFSSTSLAVTGGDWNAGRIMDDGVFFNSNSMSDADIQNFLNSQMPSCSTNHARSGSANDSGPPYTCLKDYVENPTTHQNNLGGGAVTGGLTAAQIIKQAASTYNISPRVLIILLQKEQSLITDDWPWAIQYRSATGYGCPDTAPCDAEYYGFYNQVTKAASQFRRYATYPADYRYKAYQTNYIQWSPNSACGGSNVFIQNQTTAGLYNYTPYQPNASALANLYGSGDGCGAYGNRNFWRLYSDWFGNTYGPTKIQDNPTSISWGTGRIDVFARGSDGGLYQQWYDAGSGGWHSWAKLAGTVDSAPAVSSWDVGRLDIFSNSVNGELQHLWYGGGAWGTWENLGRPSSTVSISGSPGVISWGTGRIDVFARGSDGELWQKWYDVTAGGWQPWSKLGGVLNSAPTITSWYPGRLDLFSTGPAGDLQHYWFDGNHGGWKNWESLGKPSGSVSLSTGPGAIGWDTGRLDIFGRGTDGVLWQKWFDGQHGGWKSWERFSGVLNSTPTVSSWEPKRLDLFSTGPAGDLQHYWFGTNGWGSWESLGYPRN